MSNQGTLDGKFLVMPSPHITKKGNTTQTIMRDVLISLLPVVLASVYFFGYLVLVNIVVCAIACFGFELLYNLCSKKTWTKQAVKDSSVFNLSCLVTAVILALNLPTTVQHEIDGVYKGVWGLAIFDNNRVVLDFDIILLSIVASFVAIVITKMLFGGLGKNFANPAMVGRIFLFLAVGLAAVNVSPIFGLDGKTGATWLTGSDSSTSAGLIGNMFFGYESSAAVGETSVLAILIGFIYLSVRKVIDWHVPIMIIVAAAIFAFLFDVVGASDFSTYSAARVANKTLAHVFSGGLVFGAVFMATDYSTNPNTFWGKVIFCVGIALITMLIRVYGGWPEGMSFGILCMNILTPLIDRYIVPKPFGFKKPVKVKNSEVNTQTT